MGLKDPRVGFNSVTEFMGSGLPWVTSSIATGATVYSHSFQKLTKRLSVWNHATGSGEHLRVGFTKNGIEAGNHLKIDASQTFEFDSRLKEVFIRADDPADTISYSVYAELIGIDADQMPQLTGSVNGVTFWEGVG